MAVVLPYVKNAAWADGSGGGTPITAAKLNIIEDGIFNAQQQPAARVTHNASQSITSGVTTALAFNTERFDQAGGVASTQHDTVTNNSRLTCRYAGIYMIGGNITWGVGATGYRNVGVRLNGTTMIGSVLITNNTASFGQDMDVTTVYSLAVNDYVELIVSHLQGSALSVTVAANTSPEFWMVRVA